MTSPNVPLPKVPRAGRFVAGTYAVSLGLGASQFAALLILERVLSRDDFSKISSVLGLFSTYLLLVELGIQGELIRRFASEPAFQLRPTFFAAVKLRLWGALAAWIGLIAQGLVSGVSASTLAGLASFGVCFFPAAGLLTLEAVGFPSKKVWAASALKISRLVATCVFTGAVVLVAGSVGQVADLRPIHYGVLFLVFALCLAQGLRVLWQFWGAELVRISASGATGSGATGSGAPAPTAGRLFWDTRNLFASLGVWWIFNAGFGVLNLRVHGDTNLTDFNVAQLLTIPVALLTQVLANTALARRHARTAQAHSIELSPRQEKHGMLYWGCMAALLTYGALVSLPALINLGFEKANPSSVVGYFWPLFGAQCLIAASTFAQVEAQALGSKRTPFIAACIALAVLGLGSLGFVFELLPAGSTAIVLFGAYAASGAFLFTSLNRKR